MTSSCKCPIHLYSGPPGVIVITVYLTKSSHSFFLSFFLSLFLSLPIRYSITSSKYETAAGGFNKLLGCSVINLHHMRTLRIFQTNVSAMFGNHEISLFELSNKQTFRIFSLLDLRFVLCSPKLTFMVSLL